MNKLINGLHMLRKLILRLLNVVGEYTEKQLFLLIFGYYFAGYNITINTFVFLFLVVHIRYITSTYLDIFIV